MSRQLRPAEHCLNCGQPVATRFCAHCGQENTNYHVSLGRLLGDLVEELFQLESRLWRTLWMLLRRPGLLTVEYNAGRRVRYTTPLRLYLLASLVFFFVGGVRAPRNESDVKISVGDRAEIGKELQGKTGLRRRLLERVDAVARDPRGAGQRVKATLTEWVPRIVALMVPLFALLTMSFFRRPARLYVEHLVFALHAHSAAFLLFTVGELARNGWLDLVGTVALAAWIFVAARRVFQQSWWRLSWKVPLIAVLYAIFLGVGTAAAAIVGLFSIS